jgi:hypothetical protein
VPPGYEPHDHDLVVVGHPFSTIGRGEIIRAAHRALGVAGLRCGICDIWGTESRSDGQLRREIEPYLVTNPSSGINIFHINGDEVEQVLDRFAGGLPDDSYNIIYPAWELSRYPAAWVPCLERFDEIWSQSWFTHEAIVAAVARPVICVGEASEVRLTTPLGRRHFGIPAGSYVFLFFFRLHIFNGYAVARPPGL